MSPRRSPLPRGTTPASTSSSGSAGGRGGGARGARRRAPRGVIWAAALKCAGGAIQGRLWPRDDAERNALRDAGLDPERILTTDDLVAGEDVLVAVTGVTTGALLRGVRSTPEGAVTDSLVMRSRSGTIRRIEARHAFEKLSRLSGDAYR